MALIKQYSPGNYWAIGSMTTQPDGSIIAQKELWQDAQTYANRYLTVPPSIAIKIERVNVPKEKVGLFMQIEALKDSILSDEMASDPKLSGAQVVPTAAVAMPIRISEPVLSSKPGFI